MGQMNSTDTCANSFQNRDHLGLAGKRSFHKGDENWLELEQCLERHGKVNAVDKGDGQKFTRSIWALKKPES